MPPRQKAEAKPDRSAAAAKLKGVWLSVLEKTNGASDPEIAALVNAQDVAIRFCVVTQTLAKATDLSLDALCLQSGNGANGQWDPRTFAVAVVVPWNRENQGLLGPSGDPYVSNPLRRPRVDAGLGNVKRPEAWRSLAAVLSRPRTGEEADALLREVLYACAMRLRDLRFEYVVPARVSLAQLDLLFSDFLSSPSGGHRGMAVAAALVERVGCEFGIFAKVERGAVNASDASARGAGDLTCFDADGAVRLVVEVKERLISLSDVQDVVTKARSNGARDSMICCRGVRAADQGACKTLVAQAWASGTNVYIETFTSLARVLGALLTEDGKREALVGVGRQLDDFEAEPKHRRAWVELLKTL